MKSVARSYMWWLGLDKELEQLAKSCLPCQTSSFCGSTATMDMACSAMAVCPLDFAGPFQGTIFLVELMPIQSGQKSD